MKANPVNSEVDKQKLIHYLEKATSAVTFGHYDSAD